MEFTEYLKEQEQISETKTSISMSRKDKLKKRKEHKRNLSNIFAEASMISNAASNYGNMLFYSKEQYDAESVGKQEEIQKFLTHRNGSYAFVDPSDMYKAEAFKKITDQIQDLLEKAEKMVKDIK